MTDAIEIALITDDNDQLNSVAVWDVRNGACLMQYKGGGAIAKHSLEMINNNFIVTANNVKPLLAFWPVNRYETIQNVKFVLPARADSIAVSPDGCYLVAGIHENIYVWQIATGRMLTMLTKHYQPINCIKFTDDGSHFVTAGKDGQVIVWNLSAAIGDPYRTESIEPLYSFSDHALPVTDLWIGAGGMRAILVTVSTDRTCKIYDLSSGGMLLSLVFQEMLSAVTMDRAEISLFVGTTQGNIYHHKLQPPPRTREYHITDDDKINNKFSGHSKSVTCLAVSLDEQTLMSGSEDTNVMTWNIQSRSLLKTLPHKGAITNAKFILTPQAMFNREMKLELITKSFQRMKENAESIENESFEIFTTPEMDNKKVTKSMRAPGHQKVVIKSNDNELEKLREENAKLKKINEELFQYSAKNVLKSK